MDKKRLLDRVNIFAGQRYGIRVTPRRLRDWVEEKLVPGPKKPRGRQRGQTPDRDWPLLSYRRVLQICRLKKNGAKRLNEIRITLWMNGADLPFEQVQEALYSEFQRARKLARRPVTCTWDPRENSSLSPNSQAALLRQMGTPSPALLPDGYSVPGEMMVGAYGALRYGVDNNALRVLMTDLLRHVGLSEWVPQSFDKDTQPHELQLLGLAGSPDEIDDAAEESIKNADAETFAAVRDWIRVFPWLVQNAFAMLSAMSSENSDQLEALKGPLAQVWAAVRTGPWKVAWFTMWLHFAHQQGDKGLSPTWLQQTATANLVSPS